jgi:hypothetical protein
LQLDLLGGAEVQKNSPHWVNPTNSTSTIRIFCTPWAPQQVNIGTLRETFFLSQLKQLTYGKGLASPEIRLPKSGDFVFSTPDQRLLSEVGGPKKGFGQVGEEPNHYVVADTTLAVYQM